VASRVLVVDDEPDICTLIDMALSQAGYEVATAGSGEEGVELLGTGPAFAAALVDKNLPGMSGLDVIRRIRRRDVKMAVLMMTGYASEESASEALNLDVDGYLEKPFPKITDVVDRVRDAVERRAKREAAEAAAPAPAPAAPGDAAPLPRVVVVAGDDVATPLGDVLADKATMETAADAEAMARLLRVGACDVLVVDGALFEDRAADVIARGVTLAPLAEVVVLSSWRMGLKAVQRLIEIGVRRLVKHNNHARPVLDALERRRRPKSG
jgi:CheY-like chemotaxis protein